jgi:glycosyltransferase involved in cell wall biosynthesis
MLVVSTIAATITGFLLPFADHLREQGWQVEAAANGVSGEAAVVNAFDAVHELPLSRSIRDITGMAESLRAMSRFIDSGFDIVHVHTPIASFLARFAASRIPRERRPAIVYTAHGFHFHREGSFVTNTAFSTAERVAGRWTDRLIVINEDDHEAALRHRIVPPSRLILMPGIGVDTSWYDRAAVPADKVAAVRMELGVPLGAPLFAVVGELSMRKRPFDVVAALGRMRHEDAHVVLAGDGSERARVVEAAQAAGVIDRTHLRGPVDDVRPTVLASDCLVLASSREGLPRAILEALSMAVPVVTTRARGNPDLVEPDAGLVVPIGDVPALAEAMDTILDDPDAARRMGQAGRRRVVDRYGLERVLELHDALYAELLQARRTGSAA